MKIVIGGQCRITLLRCDRGNEADVRGVCYLGGRREGGAGVPAGLPKVENWLARVYKSQGGGRVREASDCQIELSFLVFAISWWWMRQDWSKIGLLCVEDQVPGDF